MSTHRFEVIRGAVSNLQVRQGEEDFVSGSADKTVGGVAAAGLALDGLAGAATGAALSVGDTSERVDFFVCKVADQTVRGRFGTVGFADGDLVEVVGSLSGGVFDAYAIVRPSDRAIWTHPHCGRGSRAHLRFSARWIGLLAWLVSPVAMAGLMWLAADDANVAPPLWFVVTMYFGLGLLASAIFVFVASRFTKFARLSDETFAALGFENPTEVDLHKRLREASKAMTNEERLNYHPHARWVYKYCAARSRSITQQRRIAAPAPSPA